MRRHVEYADQSSQVPKSVRMNTNGHVINAVHASRLAGDWLDVSG